MSPDGTGASDSATTDVQSVVADPVADPTTQAAATGADTPILEGQPAGDGAPPADVTADDADLASYPEDIREHFRSLPPEVRKSLFGHAEANAREGWKAVQEREAQIEAARVAEEARKKAIVAKIGKYVGDEVVTKVGRDGVERTLPTLEETTRLNQNRKGREELWDKYGLDEDGIDDHIENLTERRDMLDGATDWVEDRAIGRIDGRMRDGFRAANLDEAILEQANAPEEIVPVVVRHLRAAHAVEMAKQKDEYEGRLATTNVNTEAMRGLVTASTSRTPAVGGRSGGDGPMTLSAFRALPPEQRRRMRAENPEQVDRLYASGG